MEPSEVGLVISYAINITQTLNFMVRMTADVETNIVAVERIKEYSEIKNEANWKSNNSPPANWPDCGGVEFKVCLHFYLVGHRFILFESAVCLHFRGME